MELMVLSFLIADYDILREDRKAARQRSLARNLNAASARRARLLSLSLALAPSPFKLSVALCTVRDLPIFTRPHETS